MVFVVTMSLGCSTGRRRSLEVKILYFRQVILRVILFVALFDFMETYLNNIWKPLEFLQRLMGNRENVE